MEIQDRNNLLQILTGIKENKPQFSFDGNSFADVLNSSDVETYVPQKDTKEFEFKQIVSQNSRPEINNIEKKAFESKKESVKKTDNTDNKESASQTVKKEEKLSKDEPKEDAVGLAQNSDGSSDVSKESETKPETAKENVVDGAEVSDDVAAEESFATLENATDVIIADMALTDIALSDVVAETVTTPLQTSLKTKETAVDASFVETTEEVLSVTNGIDQVVASKFLMQGTQEEKALKNLTENLKPDTDGTVLIGEDETLLAEQSKYFDENIKTDKKLKLEVNVSEEKIAAPVAKDVLKNRFEIDSMFQSVDDTVRHNALEEAVVSDDAQNVFEDTRIVPELKNSLYGEVNPIQETQKITTTKDIAVTAVSGKEVVAEIANVSKNEAFAKINETATRDTYKGMSKEAIEQIKVNITKSAVKGVDTIDIQLKPEDLGKLQIKIHIAKDGKIQAEIVASRAETADMLQKDASALSKAFNDAGYDTDAKSFTFSFRQENQANSQGKDDSGLLKFIGETLEQEAENIAGNDNLGYDPLLGLNIRV